MSEQISALELFSIGGVEWLFIGEWSSNAIKILDSCTLQVIAETSLLQSQPRSMSILPSTATKGTLLVGTSAGSVASISFVLDEHRKSIDFDGDDISTIQIGRTDVKMIMLNDGHSLHDLIATSTHELSCQGSCWPTAKRRRCWNGINKMAKNASPVDDCSLDDTDVNLLLGSTSKHFPMPSHGQTTWESCKLDNWNTNIDSDGPRSKWVSRHMISLSTPLNDVLRGNATKECVARGKRLSRCRYRCCHVTRYKTTFGGVCVSSPIDFHDDTGRICQ